LRALAPPAARERGAGGRDPRADRCARARTRAGGDRAREPDRGRRPGGLDGRAPDGVPQVVGAARVPAPHPAGARAAAGPRLRHLPRRGRGGGVADGGRRLSRSALQPAFLPRQLPPLGVGGAVGPAGRLRRGDEACRRARARERVQPQGNDRARVPGGGGGGARALSGGVVQRRGLPRARHRAGGAGRPRTGPGDRDRAAALHRPPDRDLQPAGRAGRHAGARAQPRAPVRGGRASLPGRVRLRAAERQAVTSNRASSRSSGT